MNIHEFQAKELFADASIPVQPQRVARNVDDAVKAGSELGFPVVVKAQVHTGGRGKAGGVKLAKDETELRTHATAILGMDIKGHVVRNLLVVPAVDIEREFYVGPVHCVKALDRYLLFGSAQSEEDFRRTFAKFEIVQ